MKKVTTHTSPETCTTTSTEFGKMAKKPASSTNPPSTALTSPSSSATQLSIRPATTKWPLKWFDSEDHRKVIKKFELLEAYSGDIYPVRDRIFRSLDLISPDQVKVAIFGQDPYPSRGFATGVAFSIPSSVPQDSYPPTLRSIFSEYKSDLGYDLPSTGNLEEWSRRGVLLWNSIPSVSRGAPLSQDWSEYFSLNREIIHTLCERGVVFVFLGGIARRFVDEVTGDNNVVLVTSHPSPRGSINSKTPFVGSRIFSTINVALVNNGNEPIDWKLP